MMLALGPLSLGPLVIAAPWGLLGLLMVPAILAIHWFRRRSPPRSVTGLFLYPPPVPSAASGRRRERIVASTSLWLELLAALALTWWLADVHPAADQRGRHVGIVLDDRLRLTARLPAGDSAAARLRVRLGEMLAGLRPADRVTLIASGAVPRVLAGPAATPDQARTALARWVPQAPWHELDAGLALALQITAQSGATATDVLLASDRVAPDLPAGVACVAAGEPVAASGFADARWLRDEAGDRLVVRVVASGAPAPRRIEIRRRGHVVQTSAPTVGGTSIIELASGVGDTDEITATLVGEDPLPADDQVILRRPERRIVRIALALPPAIQPVVERALRGLPGLTLNGVSNDLLITGDEVTTPGTWLLRIAPAAGSDAVLGPFLIRRGHPLASDLDGTGLLWLGGLPQDRLPVDAEPLISAGTQVLLAERRRGRDRLVTLYADPMTGTLAQHPLWPALIANVVAARRAALPGLSEPNRSANQTTYLVLPPTATAVEVCPPDAGSEGSASTTTVFSADADGGVLLPPLGQAGAWQVKLAGAPWQTLQVNALDERLGDVAGAETREITVDTPAEVAVERRRSPAERLIPLVLAALAAALACWFWARGR